MLLLLGCAVAVATAKAAAAAACPGIVLTGTLPAQAANRKATLGRYDMVSDSTENLVAGRPVYSLNGGSALFMYYSKGMWVVSESLTPNGGMPMGTALQLRVRSKAMSPDQIKRVAGTDEGMWQAFNAAATELLASMGGGAPPCA